MSIQNWEVPDTALNCICGCRPQGCKAVSADIRESGFYLEHFGCRMNTVRLSSQRDAIHEWNRIVNVKLVNMQG